MVLLPLEHHAVRRSGYPILVESHQDRVDFPGCPADLNGDGVLNAADKALKIPRLAPWNGNVGLTIEQVLPVIGRSTLRVSYAYRDASAYTDNNRGTLNELNRIDASLAIKVFDDRGTVTLFGQNLTNNAQIGSDTQLPSTLGGVALGGTFAPLSKGRVFGIELRISD